MEALFQLWGPTVFGGRAHRKLLLYVQYVGIYLEAALKPVPFTIILYVSFVGA